MGVGNGEVERGEANEGLAEAGRGVAVWVVEKRVAKEVAARGMVAEVTAGASSAVAEEEEKRVAKEVAGAVEEVGKEWASRTPRTTRSLCSPDARRETAALHSCFRAPWHSRARFRPAHCADTRDTPCC